MHIVIKLWLLTAIASSLPMSDSPSAALDGASNAIAYIGAYAADPLSRYEGKEIQAVEKDIVVFQSETDQSKLTADAERLSTDWASLVALDDILQQEDIA